VASRVGGIVAQIQNGETGWLVDPHSPEACAEACAQILADPIAARQRALRGKEYVRRNFLMPRLLRDWLVLLNKLDGNDTAGAEVVTAAAV
jgi:trehalose synthase